MLSDTIGYYDYLIGLLMGKVKPPLTLKSFLRLSKIPGFHAVGGASGLYVSVKHAHSAAWIFRYTFNGKRHDMGLGNIKYLTLVEARDKAIELHRQIRQGINPIEHNRELRAARKKASMKSVTFQYCVNKYLESHEDEWSNDVHRKQWRSTLETYACPVIGSLNVADIDTGLVLRILEPIWKTKTETAKRLRGRIESILDWAKVRQYRTGGNPARWKGHLDTLLAKPSKIAKVKNFPALPYKEIPEFMQQLRKQHGYAAAALEFVILTATRSGEVRGAIWAEIDLDARTWTVPAERMKTKKEHVVPLSDAAIDVIHRMQEMRISEYIFPGVKEGKPISKMAMPIVLKNMGRDDITVHGFRSTFRDWASETTAHPHEVCEMALAHAIKNKSEASYRRGDLFEKRKQLMDDWVRYCFKLPTT